MIRRLIFFTIVITTCNLIETITHNELKTFTLEELIPLQSNFYPERLRFTWVSDNEYVVTDSEGLKKYDARTGDHVAILNYTELAHFVPSIANDLYVMSYSDDQNFFLLQSATKKLFRHSNLADYHIFNHENRSISKLGQGPLQEVVWSKGNGLAYVQDNNVYYVPNVAQPNVIVTLTTEGVPGEVYYGTTDWIYEEEVLNDPKAMWFSQKGTYLAVASFNDTKVDSIFYPIYGEPSDFNHSYPEIVHFKYPKAGRTNPSVGLRIFKLDDLEATKAFDIPAPEGVGDDPILGRVDWASDENLSVLWLNRRQNIGILINCNLRENKCLIQKEYSEPNGWIDIKDAFFDKSGTKMIDIEPLTFEGRRFMHVARLDLDTLTTEDLSPNNGTVFSVIGWNQNTDTVYYIFSPETEPWQRQLWASSQGNNTCITCHIPSCSNVDGKFSEDGNFAIVNCNSINVPFIYYVYNTKRNEFLPIVTNSKLAQRMTQYKLPMVLFNKILLDNGVTSHIKLLLPPVMEPGKKYPMIVRVYAGPGSTRVKDSFDVSEYYSMYLSSNKSYINAAIDVRGSGAMGVEALHAVNNALGTVEVTDTLAAIRKLLTTYEFIDPHRVGVFGWSYGGFASTMMLIKDEDKTLACAVAVAPVTSWLYYDTIYTERYMDTPQANPVGYERADILLQAERLRGRRYLLVHGTADDNVHYQNTLQLAKQLQHSDIDFQQVSYTDENHSLGAVSRHLYHTLDRFWAQCFR